MDENKTPAQQAPDTAAPETGKFNRIKNPARLFLACDGYCFLFP